MLLASVFLLGWNPLQKKKRENTHTHTHKMCTPKMREKIDMVFVQFPLAGSALCLNE